MSRFCPRLLPVESSLCNFFSEPNIYFQLCFDLTNNPATQLIKSVIDTTVIVGWNPNFRLICQTMKVHVEFLENTDHILHHRSQFLLDLSDEIKSPQWEGTAYGGLRNIRVWKWRFRLAGNTRCTKQHWYLRSYTLLRPELPAARFQEFIVTCTN